MITQIGSLPYKNIEKAIQYSLKHDIPFLPELPKLKDSMFEYIKNPGSLSCLEEFKKHEFNKVKIQCVGPVTLMLGNYDENKAIESCYNHIYSIMDGLKAKEIILFLDEPTLGHAGFNFKQYWDAIFSSFNVTRGIHVCNSMDWDKLFYSDIDIISFDASEYDLTTFPKYRNNKKIAWGIKSLEDVKEFQEGDLITPPCGLFSSTEQECEDVLKLLQSYK
ncbi:MAG: hypothetical protein KKA65_03990 [Nanoarchaeota archaeon]|nr:hypothetical protein [Nanoarchaeota archaeon]MBU4456638.1 hypothetical protein [Nanoarchaeota archaeon]